LDSDIKILLCLVRYFTLQLRWILGVVNIHDVSGFGSTPISR